MACTRIDFLALLLLADLHGAQGRTAFEEAQQVQPSTTATAVSLPFAASTSTGILLQVHSSPGPTDTEKKLQRGDGPEARPRPRSLHQASKEQEHVPLVAEDESFGEKEGEGQEEGASLLDNVAKASAHVETNLRRRRRTGSRILAGGDAGAEAEAALIRRDDFASLRGQCNDGDSFTVTSGALPFADGCYSAVVGTNFGEGFFYSTDEEDKRLIYPKLITRDGESKYFWAAAAFGEFSGGTSPIDCLSVQPTSTYIHPAAVAWQCDVDGSGVLERITDEDFFAVCGCGTTATSGSSSSVLTPSPSGTTATNTLSSVETFTTTPTASPSVDLATPAPTTIPTPAASTSPPSSTSPPVTEREISGGGRRVTRMGSLTAISLGAGVCATFVAMLGTSLL